MTKSNISTKKLKAIVFTDIVDFTKLSADDEQKALEVIDRQRDLLKPIVLEHRGEWLKEIGDGLLFSFDSSLDAVNCSIKIQQALKDVDDFKIRIGIHQGDIFIKDGDVYGDDVNIASRVEGFSPEGGITISDKIYKDIQSIKEIKTKFIGHKPLKGVKQETKVRCIISNDLPNYKYNNFPHFFGSLNIYFGTLVLIIAIMFTIANMLDFLHHQIQMTEEKITLLMIFSCFNIAIIFLLFGYSTLSFNKGIAIKSQQLIYYGSIFYGLLMISYLTYDFGLISFNYSENKLETIILNILANLIFFSIPLILIKSIKFLYNKPSS